MTFRNRALLAATLLLCAVVAALYVAQRNLNVIRQDRQDTFRWKFEAVKSAAKSACRIKKVCGQLPELDANQNVTVCQSCLHDTSCANDIADFEKAVRLDFWGDQVVYTRGEHGPAFESYHRNPYRGDSSLSPVMTWKMPCPDESNQAKAP